MHPNDPRQREPQSVAEALQIRCPECAEDEFLCLAPSTEPLTQWDDPDAIEDDNVKLICVNQQQPTNAGYVPCGWSGTFGEARKYEAQYDDGGGQ